MLRQFLNMFRDKACLTGSFKLRAGGITNFYINSKKGLLDSMIGALLGQIIYERTRLLNIHTFGGPEVGAILMVQSVLAAYDRATKHMNGFYVRKQAKDHGNTNMIEGNLTPGMNVVVLEDVVTTGGELRRAIDEIEEAGGKIQQIIAIVDREKGAHFKYPYNPIFTLSQLLS